MPHENPKNDVARRIKAAHNLDCGLIVNTADAKPGRRAGPDQGGQSAVRVSCAPAA